MIVFRIKRWIFKTVKLKACCNERPQRKLSEVKQIFLLLTLIVLCVCAMCAVVWRLYPCTSNSFCSSIVHSAYRDWDKDTVRLESASLGTYHNDLTTLMDLYNFTFLKNEPKCNSLSPPFIMAIVHSSPDHGLNRQAIRETWGQDLHLVFLVAEVILTKDQQLLELENNVHHDLVQGNFLDSYRNLTYKHVMALKWVTYYCPGAKYILKTDDDVFVNTPLLKEFLTTRLSPLGGKRLVFCEVFFHNPVVRYFSKWMVTFAEYSEEYYPPHCAGWAIIYSRDVVFELYREAQRRKYFWVDDVHVTGTLLAKINVTHIEALSLAIHWPETYAMINRGVVDEFLFSLVSPTLYKRLWKMVNTPSKLNRNRTWETPWDVNLE